MRSLRSMLTVALTLLILIVPFNFTAQAQVFNDNRVLSDCFPRADGICGSNASTITQLALFGTAFTAIGTFLVRDFLKFKQRQRVERVAEFVKDERQRRAGNKQDENEDKEEGGGEEDGDDPQDEEVGGPHISIPEEDIALNPCYVRTPCKAIVYSPDIREPYVGKILIYRLNQNGEVLRDSELDISSGQTPGTILEQPSFNAFPNLGDILDSLEQLTEHDVERRTKTITGARLDTEYKQMTVGCIDNAEAACDCQFDYLSPEFINVPENRRSVNVETTYTLNNSDPDSPRGYYEYRAVVTWVFYGDVSVYEGRCGVKRNHLDKRDSESNQPRDRTIDGSF